MSYVEYSSNNSGGGWWLGDSDWPSCRRRAGRSTGSRDIHTDGRWLGALATRAKRYGPRPGIGCAGNGNRSPGSPQPTRDATAAVSRTSLWNAETTAAICARSRSSATTPGPCHDRRGAVADTQGEDRRTVRPPSCVYRNTMSLKNRARMRDYIWAIEDHKNHKVIAIATEVPLVAAPLVAVPGANPGGAAFRLGS